MRPRSPSTAHSASSSACSAQRHGTGRQVLLDVDVARRQADGAGVEALAQQVAHRRDLLRGRRPRGRRRPSRTGAAPSDRRAARRSARGSSASASSHAAERLAPAPVDALRRTRPRASPRSAGTCAQNAVALVGAAPGARLSEQLPVTTVVMPCSIAGNAYGSKQQLGVVVGVRIDEARAPRPCRSASMHPVAPSPSAAADGDDAAARDRRRRRGSRASPSRRRSSRCG